MPDETDYTAPDPEHEAAAEEGVRDAEAVHAFFKTLTRKFLTIDQALAFTLKYIEARAVANAKLQIELPPEPPDESEGWKA
jgi:hypothetical protein